MAAFLLVAAALMVTMTTLPPRAVTGSGVPTINALDEEGLTTPLFGEANMERSVDGRSVSLTLNRYSGSGFISSHYYHHGFFSEVPRSGSGGDYPSKPMALYATIWDGSTWATDNGRYKVNYKRGPFTAEFSGLVLRGCPAAAVRLDDPAALRLQLSAADRDDRCAGAELELMTADYAIMTPRKRMEMRRWRQRHMLYTVCYDTNRYPAPFPECDVNMAERHKFWESKVVRPRVRGRSGSRRRTATATATAAPHQLVSLQQAD